MQSVSPTATAARPPPRAPIASGRLGCRARLRMGRAEGEAPTTALRAQCGGGIEPVEARTDGAVLQVQEVVEDEEDAGLAPEELEMLEDEAMGGEDEGRSPTDYDRRAHIFEESARVFQALKHRRDDGDGAVTATAAESARHPQ